MGKFITNSTSDIALRLDKILSLEIRPVGVGGTTGYELEIQLSLGTANESIVFETGATFGAVQALAAPVMVALEA